MVMNPFVIVLTMYGGVMCGALALLIWAFNGRLNTAGRLFLLSEILRFPVIAIIALVQINPDYRINIVLFTMNALFLLSETAFALSAYTLSRGHIFRRSILTFLVVFLACILVEIIRLHDGSLPFLFYSIIYGIICCFTTYICTFKTDNSVNKTPFWNVLKYIESAFVVVAMIRIVIFFSSEGFSPVVGGAQNLIILAIILSLLIFRYIAYQAIWMTSAPPNTDENLLNQNLMRTLRERDRMLKKLLASNRRIGVSALASSVAHQLSQPLTGAALYIETYKRNLITEGKPVEDFETIDRVSSQLKKMASLVLNLRNLFSETKTNFLQLSCVSICDETLDLIATSTIAKTVRFEKIYSANPFIMGDAIQLQQVLINLVENALQAFQLSATSDPTIIIRVSQDAHHAILSIEDNAGGIDRDKMPNLFELYETSKEDGMGIGLWLCKTIIEKHSGEIFAENIPSAGAKFTIKLPLADRLS